jgi:osmoprotectant transport system substrate-binding protein
MTGSKPALTPRRAEQPDCETLRVMACGASHTAGRIAAALACVAVTVGLAACGAGSSQTSADAPSTTTVTSPGASTSTTTVTTTTTTTTTETVTLPGAGRPPVTIGDENTPEQFILGQLYYQALKAQGFSVSLNQSIGPTQVIMQALATGQLAMYPEYLDTWDSQVAGITRQLRTRTDAYLAGERYAQAHGLKLLDPTPFSDTEAIAVTFDYAVENDLQSIGDLAAVDPQLTLGGPPQFQQQATGLPEVESVYALSPAAFKPLEIGAQYQALDQGTVQAAVVNTTDPQLLSGSYPLLSDPLNVFGWGNVVPVASVHALDAEGPDFEATVNRVSALLTLPQMRELNAAVVLDNQDPATVAQQFLQSEGLLPAPASSTTGSSTSP